MMWIRKILGQQIAKALIGQRTSVLRRRVPSTISGVTETFSRRNGTQIHFQILRLKPLTPPLPPPSHLIFYHPDCSTASYAQLVEAFPEAAIITFDFPGIGQSTGPHHCQANWIEDTIAFIQFIQARFSVTAKKTLLVGEELSGAIFTLAAAELWRRQNQTVNLINLRSFARLAPFLFPKIAGRFNTFLALAFTSLIGGLFYTILGIAPATLAAIFFSFISAIGFLAYRPPYLLLEKLLRFSFGQMDVHAAYQLLPPSQKDYLMVSNDEIIPKWISLHSKLKEGRRFHMEYAIDEPTLENLFHSKLFYRILPPFPRRGEKDKIYQGAHSCSIDHLISRVQCRHFTLTSLSNNALLIPNGMQVLTNKIKRLLSP